MASAKKFLVAASALLPAALVFAHHSFMAEFDQRKPVTLEGVVTNVEWINPHSYFYLDVKDKSGKTVKWALETGSPSALLSRGWARDTIKVGDTVKVYCLPGQGQGHSSRCKVSNAQEWTNTVRGSNGRWRSDQMKP